MADRFPLRYHALLHAFQFGVYIWTDSSENPHFLFRHSAPRGRQQGTSIPSTTMAPLLWLGSAAEYYDYVANSFYRRGLNRSYVSPNYGSFDETIAYKWKVKYASTVNLLMDFYAGIVESGVYPLTLLFQILTVIFLVRGNSGYSRSARNWFLLVLGADIASILYLVYNLIILNFRNGNPFNYGSGGAASGNDFHLLMWGLRSQSDAALQNMMCKIFNIAICIPLYLSPLAQAVSSLIRSFCVKFPLRSKAEFTTRIDRSLMALTVSLSLAISAVTGALVAQGITSRIPFTYAVFGVRVYQGLCYTVTYQSTVGKLNNLDLAFIGVTFMLVAMFVICALNLLASVIVIYVLFDAKKRRQSMTASVSADSNAEIRATAKLLGMNIMQFLCLLVSRVLIVTTSQSSLMEDIKMYNPLRRTILSRTADYLFNIPYCTNMLFVAAFNKKFYEFYLPCIAKKKPPATSELAVRQRTSSTGAA